MIPYQTQACELWRRNKSITPFALIGEALTLITATQEQLSHSQVSLNITSKILDCIALIRSALTTRAYKEPNMRAGLYQQYSDIRSWPVESRPGHIEARLMAHALTDTLVLLWCLAADDEYDVDTPLTISYDNTSIKAYHPVHTYMIRLVVSTEAMIDRLKSGARILSHDNCRNLPG